MSVKLGQNSTAIRIIFSILLHSEFKQSEKSLIWCMDWIFKSLLLANVVKLLFIAILIWFCNFINNVHTLQNVKNHWLDGKITQKSEFESALFSTIIAAIKDGGYTLDEMTLLWLFCKAWGPHAEHILSQSGFWKFLRDHLRKILFDLCFPDPDEIQPSNELVSLLKTKLQKDKKPIKDWCDLIYKESIATIPKRWYLFSF